MAQLEHGKRYRLPNSYIVRANWDTQRELWLLNRENDGSWWFVGENDKLWSLLFGLSSLETAAQHITTPWDVSQLEEVEMGLNAAKPEERAQEKVVKRVGKQNEEAFGEAPAPKAPKSRAAHYEQADRRKLTVDRSKLIKRAAAVVGIIVALYLGIRFPQMVLRGKDPATVSAATVIENPTIDASVSGSEVKVVDKPLLDLEPGELREKRDTLAAEAYDQYLAGLMGNRVEWDGKVVDILPDGEVAVRVDASQGVLDIVSAKFSLADSDLAKIKTGAKITFQGDISSITNQMGPAVRLKNVVLVD